MSAAHVSIVARLRAVSTALGALRQAFLAGPTVNAGNMPCVNFLVERQRMAAEDIAGDLEMLAAHGFAAAESRDMNVVAMVLDELDPQPKKTASPTFDTSDDSAWGGLGPRPGRDGGDR